MSAPETKTGPVFMTVELETPIVRGDQKITEVKIRKPGSGELRGTTLVDVAQMDVTTLVKLLPRITTPVLTEADVIGMDAADLMSIASEVSGFLLGKGKRASLGL